MKRIVLPLALLSCTGDKESASDSTTPEVDSGDSGETDTDTDTDTDADTDTTVPEVAIAGDWVDQQGFPVVINNVSLSAGPYNFLVHHYFNSEAYLVGENAAENPEDGGLWSRFDWVLQGSTARICHTIGNAGSMIEADDTPAANNQDLATGCRGAVWPRISKPLEIAGLWMDNFGGTHQISENAWVSGESTYEVSQFDNAIHILIAQNASTNTYNPGLWSRFDWTRSGNDYYFCQTAYAAATEAEALATPAANNADLATGCGTFPWSKLTTPLLIAGSYTDAHGVHHTISQTTWDMGTGALFAIQFLDNNGQFLAAQNDPGNTLNPGLYSRFDWTVDTGTLYYCQVTDSAADLDTARIDQSASRSDLAAGCKGLSWTALLPN